MGLRAAGLLPHQEPSLAPAPSISACHPVYLHHRNLSWQGRGVQAAAAMALCGAAWKGKESLHESFSG